MDTKTRTLVKTISYRFFGMFSLISIAFIFNKGIDWMIFLAILSWSIGFVSFIIHERIWNFFNTLKDGLNDLKRRSLVKTITWRLWSLLVIYLITVFILGDSPQEGIVFTIVGNTLFTLVHYFHERGWNLIKWGKDN